jgi:hypothetical protein
MVEDRKGELMKATTNLTMIAVAGTFLVCFGLVTLAAALPPDPDNAALLYYQAFLLIPQTGDHVAPDLVANVANGTIPPNDQARQYIKDSRAAIDCALAAAQLQHCNWGLRYSQGFSVPLPYLAQVRSLSRLVLTDARILAADGDYRQALDRCLATYRLAGHVGDEVLISFLVGVAVSAQASKGVTSVLSQMPADVDTLAWLKTQLALTPAASLTVQRAIVLEQEVVLQTLRPERIDDLPGIFGDSGAMTAEEIRGILDESVLARAREYCSNYMASMLTILSSQVPYEECYTKLEELANRMEQTADKDPAVKLLKNIAAGMSKVYALQVRQEADFRALQAALDLYIAKAATGRLPSSLPAASPRDPYTGGAFQYERTTGGFVLRCGARDLDKNEVREYRFTTLR